MKKNMSALDRGIRIVIALAIAVSLITGVFGGTFGVILGIVAVVLLLTSVVGFCPLYAPLKISTRRHQGAESR
jgi:hypothetical protein